VLELHIELLEGLAVALTSEPLLAHQVTATRHTQDLSASHADAVQSEAWGLASHTRQRLPCRRW
jgi:hypothetical protein